MTIPHRAGLENFPPYRQGKAPTGIDGLKAFKLSSNENPYPPLPSVTAAVIDAVANINLYPEIAAEDLTHAIAHRWAVSPENIALGAGSVEVASQIIHAITNPGDKVMFPWRSFEAYPLLATVAGATPQPIPLAADGSHDLAAMAAAVTRKTKVIFICNPNNPTGSVLSATAVETFVQSIPSDVVVVLDEAYVHFNCDPATAVGVDMFRKYPNVAVLHTFSKAYGLAGLRLGYAIAAPDLITTLRKVAVPFAVTALAQQAGVASLQAENELQERIDILVTERRRVHAALLDAGLPVLQSEANFLWLDSRDRTGALTALFEENALSVRAFPEEGIRITIGTPEANNRILDVARQAAAVLARQP
ncbi:histidinol-phosphate aminotransferase [Pseudarthrobacter sp. W1I19]|uniref:histidinol-phosphate transaminase n=1 Tax=Pseudarthrobacter sp. W1I19 TaxID=3042288 RepID=UPI00277E8F96|nr:histidinol-phosphate transaminase [Pseudarthrobacter sp. W1I19]MDQ0923400.1 histidinol-phosphate aminotransferase [Pseudarthrobacter sp. W1I19]